ncbi:MAG TPA: molecular chaperone DnaK, partial [Pirellulales bacterium]|nr:molecular chaperone DnaK [Pirellulales bacterium]
AITRYLAEFLTAHRFVALPPSSAPPTDYDPARPDVVLFNGGVFDAPLLRERLLEVIRSWFPAGARNWQPQVLENERRDLAVARGAAYYGMVRRGRGVRIAAGLARSYYIGATTAQETSSAVCILPAGVEEGQSVELADREFHLLIRQPVEFPLYVSSTQLTARAGDLAAIDPERMTALPPIRTVLQSGKKTGAADSVAVHLHVRLTEIGTLELWCSEIAGPRTWRLQFDVRAATRTDLAGHEGLGERAGIVDQSLLEACLHLIRRVFGPVNEAERLKPESLVKLLAEVSEMPRSAWPPSLLREMWEALMEVEPGRKRSPAHEARWLSLLGFALRPGYGMAVDDWRVTQTRRLLGSLAYNNPTSRAEWWILWRRIAGGLPAGQQRALAQPPIAEIRNAHRALAKGRGLESRSGSHEAAELWRMLGSLELLGIPDKIDLGNMLLDIAPREKVSTVQSAAIWALGRIGERVPMYGPLNTVVPADVVAQWSERLMKVPNEVETAPLALMQMARKTGDRYRDVTESLRSKVLNWLNVRQVPPHFIQLVAEGGQLEEAEQTLVFGESLPQGLRLQ